MARVKLCEGARCDRPATEHCQECGARLCADCWDWWSEHHPRCEAGERAEDARTNGLEADHA